MRWSMVALLLGITSYASGMCPLSHGGTAVHGTPTPSPLTRRGPSAYTVKNQHSYSTTEEVASSEAAFVLQFELDQQVTNLNGLESVRDAHISCLQDLFILIAEHYF